MDSYSMGIKKIVLSFERCFKYDTVKVNAFGLQSLVGMSILFILKQTIIYSCIFI